MSEKDIERWITVNGTHIPIRKGQTESEALSAFLRVKRDDTVIQINPRTVLDFSSVTKKEWAQWYSAIGEIKRGMWCPIVGDKYMITIGSKIFLTGGTYGTPKLDAVFEFSSQEEAICYIRRRNRK